MLSGIESRRRETLGREREKNEKNFSKFSILNKIFLKID